MGKGSGGGGRGGGGGSVGGGDQQLIPGSGFPGTARFSFRQERSGHVAAGVSGSTGEPGSPRSEGAFTIGTAFETARYNIPAPINRMINSRVRSELVPASEDLLRHRENRRAGKPSNTREANRRVQNIMQNIADQAGRMANR